MINDSAVTKIFQTICGIYGMSEDAVKESWLKISQKTIGDFSLWLTNKAKLNQRDFEMLSKLENSTNMEVSFRSFISSLDEKKRQEAATKTVMK